MHSDWGKFNECMMSGTRSPVRYISRGEEGVRASDLGPFENQASIAEVYLGRSIKRIYSTFEVS